MKKELEEVIGKNKPKKPLTPFFKYLQIMRPNIIAKFPHYNTTEVVKLISQQWAEETAEYKQELHKKYNVEHKEYINKLIEYEKTLTSEDKSKLLALKYKVEAREEKLKHKKYLKSLGKPSKPATAFLLYVKQMMKTKENDTPCKVYMQYISSQWKNMTEVDKKQFVDEASQLMEKYREEKVNWMNKMIKEGHLNILPKYLSKLQSKKNSESE